MQSVKHQFKKKVMNNNNTSNTIHPLFILYIFSLKKQKDGVNGKTNV